MKVSPLAGVVIAAALVAVLVSAEGSNCVIKPEQVHASLGSSPWGDEKVFLNVMWKSQTYADYKPWIVFGSSPTSLGSKNGDYVKCSTRSYVAGAFYHDCTFGPISPRQPYYYRVGQADCDPYGDAYSPVAQMVPQPPANANISVAIFGDLGTTNVEGTLRSLSDDLRRGLVSMLVHVGDISYADHADPPGPNPEYEPITDRFFELIEPVARRAPYLVTPGNHDVTCHIKGDEGCLAHHRNFTVFNTRWRMPSSQSHGVENLWYSFNYGNVHFVSINTESDYPKAPYEPGGATSAGGFGDQLKWLHKDLTRATDPARRQAVPWIVILGHRPLYSTSTIDYPSDQQERSRMALEPIFRQYKVDVFISGHVHLFERTYPLDNYKVTQRDYNNPGAPVYIINGAGGNLEGHPTNIMADLPPYIARREKATYGYGILRTDRATSYLSATGANHTLIRRPVQGPAMLRLCHHFVEAGTSSERPVDSICITKAA